MSDHSEIDSSASSSGSEESIDLSDSNSEASETIIHAILLLNTQLSQVTRKTDFQICPGYLHVHK